MNLSALFIYRPVATSLLTLAIVLAGILAFLNLPVSSLPQVDFPTINVQAQLPGASAETMAATVATPLERALGRIAGITEMTSGSSQGSYSDYPAIRPGSRHQRRGPRCAGGDQCRGQPAAYQYAQSSQLPAG
jgi:AcrB/AcrD/AcrF family.